jgi:glycerol-3-phosphate acyltransferase PlsX
MGEKGMRIVLDAMGSDNCPEAEILGALEAGQLFGEKVILVGPENEIKNRLDTRSNAINLLEIVNAEDVITMEDKGLQLALKAKRKGSRTSMAVGIDLIKSKDADAFVTAGNTGGALATAFYRLGIIPGVERPALTAQFPVKGGTCVVLDIGANPECKAEHLAQFAIFGSTYSQLILGVENPRVGLLSNGEEPGKGNELVKETFQLLSESDLNFIGNIEGKELYAGDADVVVTDGFTGNILLKASEAVAKLLIDTLRDELKSGVRTSIGALLARPAFNKLRTMLDPAEVGAVPLLGIDGLVFVGHGRSDARAIVSAIKIARQAVEADLNNALKETIQAKLENLKPKVSI